MARWILIGVAALAFGLSACGSTDEDDGGSGGSGAGGSGGGGGGEAACFATPWLTPTCIACRQQNCNDLMVTAFGEQWMTVGSLGGLCGAAYECECQCSETDSACLGACVAMIDNPCIDAYSAANTCGIAPCGSDCSM